MLVSWLSTGRRDHPPAQSFCHGARDFPDVNPSVARLFTKLDTWDLEILIRGGILVGEQPASHPQWPAPLTKKHHRQWAVSGVQQLLMTSTRMSSRLVRRGCTISRRLVIRGSGTASVPYFVMLQPTKIFATKSNTPAKTTTNTTTPSKREPDFPYYLEPCETLHLS